MQQLSNFHSHCDFCDGRAPMERFVQYAISKKLTSFGFSSHAPVPFVTRWAMKEDDMPDYIQEFNRLKAKYATDISLYLGLEIDYFPNEKTAVFDAVKNLPLDYRIGSIHFIDAFPDGTRWIIDGNAHAFKVATEQIYENDVKKAVKRYFEVSEQMVHTASFDIIGHMDKIVPNASEFADFDMNASWYKELMLSMLSSIKEKGIIIEINTKSLFSRGMTFPNQQYFQQIHNMKIPIMVNSDCHYPDMITASFEETYTMLKEAGFKTVMSMVDGKWVDVEI
jgi:histidinol-phosphatase (PHP family)